MKNNLLLILLIIGILPACGHLKKDDQNKPSPEISKFFNEIKESNFTPNDPAYMKSYENYLYSVQNVFTKNGLEDKFDVYLNSLRNNNQVLSHTQTGLPQKFANDKGKRPNTHSAEYKLYRTKVMTSLHDRLNQERAEKLRSELGFEMYSDLVRNNRKFNERNEQGKPEFLFPL
jgi:hypothetical protein